MKIFVINVGNVEYSKFSLPLIKKLCDFNDIELVVLEKNIPQNIYNCHPSWLKLFCHDLVDDDFILCWDLDLVPSKLYNIKELIDFNNLNLCYDRAYVNEGFTFNGKFKFNCGLIGIPKKYQNFMRSIYDRHARFSEYPSYEQYYVNDEIYDNKIMVNLLNIKLNKMFDGTDQFSEDSYNCHYTGRFLHSLQHRSDLIKNHYEKYKGNLGL